MDPAELERRIVHEEGGVLVVDKPFDLPSTGHQLDDPDSLQFALIERCGAMVWAVHQLDADTSGVNVFVREKRLVKTWQANLRYPNARKHYLAICHGRVAGDHLLLDRDIDGRPAVTQVTPLDLAPEASLLRVTLETGRTHQIRIHLAAAGHPLVGEKWYRQPRCDAHGRQALHAATIAWPGGTFTAPLPADLAALCERLGLRPGNRPAAAAAHRR